MAEKLFASPYTFISIIDGKAEKGYNLACVTDVSF